MSDEYNGKHLKLWTPATYQIEVEGDLAPIWSDRLADMRISHSKRADQSTVTMLTGCIKDQAQLFGVLNSLYDLHLPILKVAVMTSK